MKNDSSPIDDDLASALAGHVNGIIRALLVAGRQGAPAEGRIPFNPLYFNILRTLGADGPCRPSFIADRLAVPRTTMSTAIKALTRKKLITTSVDEADRRATALSLSAGGQSVLDAILRQDLRNATAMLTILDKEERAAFVAAIGKVATGISAE
ncbi:MAG: MarR family winged helix-turn-helix transcriptional regulator [Pseudomonadota bacterium]